MFIGHNAVGFAAKRIAPEVSLGTLFLAVQLPDLLWPVLLLTGHETVHTQRGDTPFLNLRFDYYPFSHSLLGCVAMGLILGLLWHTFSKKKTRRGVLVLTLAVVSHWVLDWVTHIPDMPLAFQSEEKYGLSLWRSVPVTMAVEIALFAWGVFLYAKGTTPKSKGGKWSLWSFVGFLLLLYLGNASGPVPPNAQVVAYLGLSSWLMVFWGYWIDATRRTGATPPTKVSVEPATA